MGGSQSKPPQQYQPSPDPLSSQPEPPKDPQSDQSEALTDPQSNQSESRVQLAADPGGLSEHQPAGCGEVLATITDDKPTPDDKPIPDDKPAPDDKPTPNDKPTPDDKPIPDEKPTPDDMPTPDDKPTPESECAQVSVRDRIQQWEKTVSTGIPPVQTDDEHSSSEASKPTSERKQYRKHLNQRKGKNTRLTKQSPSTSRARRRTLRSTSRTGTRSRSNSQPEDLPKSCASSRLDTAVNSKDGLTLPELLPYATNGSMAPITTPICAYLPTQMDCGFIPVEQNEEEMIDETTNVWEEVKVELQGRHLVEKEELEREQKATVAAWERRHERERIQRREKEEVEVERLTTELELQERHLVEKEKPSERGRARTTVREPNRESKEQTEMNRHRQRLLDRAGYGPIEGRTRSTTMDYTAVTGATDCYTQTTSRLTEAETQTRREKTCRVDRLRRQNRRKERRWEERQREERARMDWALEMDRERLESRHTKQRNLLEETIRFADTFQNLGGLSNGRKIPQ